LLIFTELAYVPLMAPRQEQGPVAQRPRFGIQLHTDWPLADYPRLARVIEDRGFGELTVHDVIWNRPVWPVLTLIAEHTSRVLVGPDVTHPFARHPVVTAANIAAIDELSGGRAILGLGQGSFFEPAGIEHDRPVAAVRELIEVVRRLLAGDRSGFEGQRFRLEPGAALRFPARPAPMFVGTFGPRMIEMAAGLVDEVRPPGQWASAYLEVVQRHIRRGAGRAGRDPAEVELAVDVWPFASRDRAAAQAMAERHTPRFLPYMKTLTDFYGIDPADVPSAAATFTAVGDAAELIDGCQRLLAAGAKRITFSGALGPDVDEALAILSEVAYRLS
jgi:5,10-methylenetetrahydromethanopterin reductase